MGKGNRARAMRAQEKLDNPKKFEKKKKAPQWILPAVMVLIIVVVVATLALSALDNSGIFKRASTAVSSDHYQVSGTMMTYFFRNEYMSFVNQYESILSYIGLNTSASLKTQECAMMGEGQTWFDYFMSSATSYVSQLLVYCEAARDMNIVLSDESKANIDTSIKQLETTAASAGYSLKGYINAMYGSGVNESDIRSCLEIIYLASQCASAVNDDYESKITDDDINTYYNENPASFLKADYIYNVFSASKPAIKEADYDTTEAYEAAKANAEEQYQKDLAEAKEKAEKLLAMTNADAFHTNVVDYYTELLDGFYDNEDLTAEEIEKKEADELASKLKELTVTGHAYADPADEKTSELDKWLFDSARKVGDTHMIETDSEDGNIHTIYVYSVQKTTYREEYNTLKVGFAFYDAKATDAMDKANALKEQFVAGETKTTAALVEMAEKAGATYYVERDSLARGDFGYDEVDEYLFDSGLLPGICGVVETEDYVVVAFYESDGPQAWYVAAKEGVLTERTVEWTKEKTELYKVEIHDKVVSRVAG